MNETPAVDSEAPHLITRTIHEEVWVPEHMPRKSTAAYRRIHHQMVVIEDRPCLVCGVRNSTLHDPAQNRYGATAIETHHHIVEWSLANCIDLDKFNARIVARLHAEGKPGYEQPFTQAEMLAWIDHDRANLWVLCLLPDAPVLMADGTERPIIEVSVGDRVIGHDGHSHNVTATIANDFDGDMIVIDGLAFTPDHPVLTPGGWIPAKFLRPGSLLLNVGVSATQVVALRSEELQVLDPIVSPVLVDMVDDFAASQSASEVLFHDPAVFGDRYNAIPAPNLPNDISFRANRPTHESRVARTREAIQPLQSTRIATKLLFAPPDGATRLFPARLADEGHRVFRMLPGSTCALASEGTGDVFVAEGRGDLEWFTTLLAGEDDAVRRATLCARWRPIVQVESFHYQGKVYDIETTGCHSFIAQGVAVHNCDVHHRGVHAGIHYITDPIWSAQDLIKEGYTLVPPGSTHADEPQPTQETP